MPPVTPRENLESSESSDFPHTSRRFVAFFSIESQYRFEPSEEDEVVNEDRETRIQHEVFIGRNFICDNVALGWWVGPSPETSSTVRWKLARGTPPVSSTERNLESNGGRRTYVS